MNDTPQTIHADVLVVSFGKGGKSTAAQLAKRGKRVVLVEGSPRMYGGTCPNVGCVPSKRCASSCAPGTTTDSPVSTGPA